MELFMKRWFSSMASDTSNPIKCFEDCLQKAYWINDKYFRRVIAEKEIVKKWQEYIEFEIRHFTW